jgi:hypothetical protein
MRVRGRGTAAALAFLLASFIRAQEKPPEKPPDEKAPAEQKAPEKAEVQPFRPPEGTIIINLPSAEVSPLRTLQLHFTHRFSEPLRGSDIHSLFTFDSGADVGIGLSYVPLRDFEVMLLRNRSLEDYELSTKYRLPLPQESPFGVALRIGGDARTQSTPSLCETSPRPPECSFADHKYSFFAQAVGAVTVLSRVRLSAVPTFITYSAQQPFVVSDSIHQNVFNVPVAAAIAVTHSVNVQAEVYPRRSQANAGGVGWILAVEKTLLRHRFSFTVGNLRPTTVDQYIGADFGGRPEDFYIGFNLIRQWKL